MTSKITMNAPHQTPRASGVAAYAASANDAHKVMPIPKAEVNFDADRMRQNITDAISKLNDMMVAAKRGLNFSVDEKLGRPIIYVKNTATGEVVRQIPNEVVVRIAHGIEDLKGLLHNKSS